MTPSFSDSSFTTVDTSRNSKWYFWLGAIAFLLCCYQDCPAVDFIGEIARSPIFFLLPLLVIVDYKVKPKSFYAKTFTKLSNIFKIIIICLTLSSLMNLFIWFLKGNSINYLKENLIVKSLKQILYYALFYYVFKVIYICFMYKENFKKLNKIFFTLVVLHLAILVWELLQMPYAFDVLHAEPNPYYRVRLLTMESSTTGSLVVLLYTGMLATAKRKYEKITAHIFLGFYCAVTLSKMFLIVFPISLILLLLFKSKKIKRSYIIFLLGAVLTVAYFLIPFMIELFSKDLEEYTSSVSRATSFVTGIILGFKNIIGTGGLYAYYFIKQIPDSTKMVLNFLDSTNTAELDSWGIAGDKFISAGSTLAEWGMLIGPIGFYLFFKLCKTLYKSTTNNYLLFGIFYFVIVATFSETMVTRVTWPIFFALVAGMSDVTRMTTLNTDNQNVKSYAI